MTSMQLKFKVQAKIQKPVAEVFDAVYNPKKLSAYFTTGGASAPLDPGTTVTWDFADFPGAFPVHVKEVVKNQLIAFEWDKQRVEMTFEALSDDNTLLSISEGEWPETQKGLDQSYGNCHGWTQMSCALKAYVEHGINLREGFY
jgi:uncharacterized protein YndB with AHSA1/START domain